MAAFFLRCHFPRRAVFDTERIGQPADAFFDLLQNIDDLRHALAGDVLERTGFENLHNFVIDGGLVSLRVLDGEAHHGFGAVHNRMGGVFRIASDRFKFGARRRDALLRNVVRTHFADFFFGLGDIAGNDAKLIRAALVKLLEETAHKGDQRFGLLHQIDELGFQLAGHGGLESVNAEAFFHF